MLKKIVIIILIIIISGVSGILANRYFFPYLATAKLFSKYKILEKSAENVTVINKTEQVYIREDSSVGKIASQITPAIVNIVSYPNPTSNAKEQVAFKNGTGSVITSDGIIMTYASAILSDSSLKAEKSQPFKYKIMAIDGNVYDGELLYIDSYSSLAFLKINASNLPVISFGNSDDFGAGERIIAIGNDMPEYQNRFNIGILNSLDYFYSISGQTIPISEKLSGVYLSNFNSETLSSGGLAVDYSGQVIGVIGNTTKNGRNEYFEIPANKVKEVMSKIMNKDFNSNPTLGIYYVMLNKSFALSESAFGEKGALIYSPSGQEGLAIIAGSPAQKAGLRLSDIILKIGDREINPSNNLSAEVYRYKKGEQVEFTITRGGQEIKIPVQF